MMDEDKPGYMLTTHLDGLGHPTWLVNGRAICIVGDQIMWTRGSEGERQAIEDLIQALDTPCGLRLFGFMPECVLPLGHGGEHQDGVGGYYGPGGGEP